MMKSKRRMIVAGIVMMAVSSMSMATPYYGWMNEYNGSESNTLAAWNFNSDELGISGGATPTPYAVDISGNGKTCYLYGSKASAAAGGKFDYGFHVASGAASSDYGQATGTAGLHGMDESISIEMWVKLNNLGGTQYLIDKKYADSIYNGYQIYITQNGDLNRIWWNFGTGSATEKTIADVEWQAGQYYHLAVTWDAATDTAKIYRDGVELVSKTVAGAAIASSTYNIRFGQRIGGTYYPLNDGMIDGVRISNVAYEFATVPEPATAVLLAVGALLFRKK